jgi:stringent starvation protein B
LVTANDVVDDEVVVNGRRRGRDENAFIPLDETMAATAREAQAIFMVEDTGGMRASVYG